MIYYVILINFSRPKVVEESESDSEEEDEVPVKKVDKKKKKGGKDEKVAAVTKDIKKLDIGTKKNQKKKVVVSDGESFIFVHNEIE